MKRINCYRLACPAVFLLLMVVGLAATAVALPNPNSAVIGTRIFNDCPGSTLNYTNNYPASIMINDDAEPGCGGFANLHNWSYSEDGTNPAIFMNGDVFEISADLVIEGPGQGEAGMRISPWWSPDVDGRVNVRTTDGEIACFGGVVPFYSFTANHGISYVKGTPIHIEMAYSPHANSNAYPGIMQYTLIYNSTMYTSGPLQMLNCNVAEQPIYGCYGILNFARTGGFIQPLWQAGGGQLIQATWTNIGYTTSPTPTVSTTWGRLKTLYR